MARGRTEAAPAQAAGRTAGKGRAARALRLWLALAVACAAGLLAAVPAWASTNGHTQAEAVAWARDRADEHWEINDGSGGTQCTEFVWKYYEYLVGYHVGGNAYDYLGDTYGACPAGWSRPSTSSAQPGDIVVWAANKNFRADWTDYAGKYGHIGVIISVSGNTMVTAEANAGEARGACGYKYNREVSCISGIIRPDWPDPTPYGSEMSSGAGRWVPDGDYEVVSLTDTAYALDIAGDDVPASSGTNMTIWKRGDPAREQDVFTLTYLDNGFYRITQRGTGMSLDVDGASARQGTNVQMYATNDSTAQQWSISPISTEDGSTTGFRLQARCSGYSLDVAGGTAANGTNVQQYANNDTTAQGWALIPYRPAQTLPEGRYVLVSALSDALELDVAGNTGAVENGCNVQLWESSGCLGQYNSFDVTKLGNGYYRLVHVASGKALDSYGGTTTEGANVEVWDKNGSDAQQWAVTRLGDGYLLRPRCSGLAMDVCGGNTANGTNVRQWTYNGSKAQTWLFVKAEHTVSFDANGGTGAPGAQVKYYKDALALSGATPTRPGYAFAGWATSRGGTAAYQPGGTYTADSDVVLYATWRQQGTDGHRQRFVDVSQGTSHWQDIDWLADQGISTGWARADGTREFRPLANIRRADMAAFLHRLAGSPAAPASSRAGFADVSSGTDHAADIRWLAATGISEGWAAADGRREFRPYANVARADMAAFLYRLAGSPAYAAPAASPFKDVTPKTAHYKEICWLASTGVSEGWTVNGRREFRPDSPIARCDMAAFLHRMSDKGLVASW